MNQKSKESFLVAAWYICAIMLCFPINIKADEVPFKIINGLFDASQKETMGLDYAPGAETVTVFASADNTDHYANGVVMAVFKGNLYCMWQSSKQDEDADDTWVAYSRSTDGGKTWEAPMVLCPTIPDGYCASGGWLATEEKLVGYINTRPNSVANSGGYTRYVESSDGINWTEPQPVMMADGTQLDGIFEQDPHVLPDGRIICAAHFQPGLKLCPIYTDDPTGTSGWKKGNFAYTDNGTQSAELEPSFFLQSDGTLVMVMRDQKGSYFTLAATSTDRGETWTKAVQTNMPDSRAKQCAGNLPDGTAFLVNNPGRVTDNSNTTWRVPLALTLSADGKTFDRAYLLRSGRSDDYPTRRYEGKSKTLGYSYPKALVHDGYLYVSYSTNKDDAQYTRVPINNIVANVSDVIKERQLHIEGRQLILDDAANVEIFNMSGVCTLSVHASVADLSSLPAGIYIVKILSSAGLDTYKILIK